MLTFFSLSRANLAQVNNYLGKLCWFMLCMIRGQALFA